MERVYLSACSEYKYTEVEKSVFECLDGLEGTREKIVKGSFVLVKVNLLTKKNPEEAVTTHPFVAEAIVRYFQALGCRVMIADSPGGYYSEKILKSIYNTSGMTGVAERTGCELNYDISSVDITFQDAKMLKYMQIIKPVEDADFIISASKLKTHTMMTYTGAVKNLFGVIPGVIKADYHLKMNDVDNFAEHLIDICEYVKPTISVMDAIEGMEGNGPSSGDVRRVGAVIASLSPYALDTIATSLVGIDPMIVPTIRTAANRNIFSGKMKDVEIAGSRFESFKIKPFKLPDSVMHINFAGNRFPNIFESFLLNTIRPKPEFNFDICTSCGECKRSCPPGVIDMKTGKPVVNLDRCIRCFCCHELCPQKAVTVKRHWLHRLLIK